MLLSLDLLTARVRLYGITTMQTFAYYRNYRNDTTMLKVVVCTCYLIIHPLIIESAIDSLRLVPYGGSYGFFFSDEC